MLIFGFIVMNRPHRDYCMMNQTVRCDGEISGHHDNVVIKQQDKPDERPIHKRCRHPAASIP